MSGRLVSEVFAGRFGMSDPMTDSAILRNDGMTLAFTTDSYVVDPLFFPGGDIGKLAVCGTVNDLAVSGAVPAYLTASFIIEEGFLISDLITIASSMAEAAEKACVKIVTGDTKVVEKGKCHGLFITTAGIGILSEKHGRIGSGEDVRQGDRLLINGPLGNHSVAVLGARKDLGFKTEILSDCAPLNHLIAAVVSTGLSIRFMRDITRGGLATVLNELSSMTCRDILIEESSIPVDEPVRGICEILGFDPLYLANEGKVLIVAGEEDYQEVLRIMSSDPLGSCSAVIGEITLPGTGMVIMNTSTGGKRIVDYPQGILLPRIC
jgi:hydrogenase expression/formation protein HypE